MFFRYDLADIDQAAERVLSSLGSARVICFHGEMGVGKTTLIQAICQRLDVQGSFGSPTFPIINEYGIRNDGGVVYHMDLYRLSDLEEAERAGVSDALYSGSMCFVEWPEKVPEVLPPDALHLNIQMVDEEKRSIQLLNK
ncbi:MAG: tRNA (adenosine(37)-N6)-threonylcarbamoyltransferase complex ATPase subunit type 1 TsaE [Bacteroidota bacterium]